MKKLLNTLLAILTITIFVSSKQGQSTSDILKGMNVSEYDESVDDSCPSFI